MILFGSSTGKNNESNAQIDKNNEYGSRAGSFEVQLLFFSKKDWQYKMNGCKKKNF